MGTTFTTRSPSCERERGRGRQRRADKRKREERESKEEGGKVRERGLEGKGIRKRLRKEEVEG